MRVSFKNGLLALVAFSRLHAVSAILRYIDDQLGDEITGVAPIYLPAGAWSSSTSFCPSCAANQSAFNDTVSEISSNQAKGTPGSVSFSFKGTSIHIFILTSDAPSTITTDPETVQDTSLSFLLDGESVQGFTYKSKGTADPDSLTDGLNYYVNAYNSSTLALKNHTFVIQNTGISHAWFDYALYDDGKPDPNAVSPSGSNSASGSSRTSSIPTGSTIGVTASATASSSRSSLTPSSILSSTTLKAVIGACAIAALVIGGLGFFCWRKKRRSQHTNPYNGMSSTYGDKPYDYSHTELGAYPPPPHVAQSQTPSMPTNSYNHLLPAKAQYGMPSPSSHSNIPASNPFDTPPLNQYVPPPGPPPGHAFPGGFAIDQGVYPFSVSSTTHGSPSYPSPSSAPSAPPMTSTVTTLVPGSGYVMTAGVDPSAIAVREKHAEIEQEYAQHAREQEDALLARAASRGALSSQAHAGPSSASTTSHATSNHSQPPPEWKAEMDRLRGEMARMQDVQRQVVYELGTAPPPQYSDEQSATGPRAL